MKRTPIRRKTELRRGRKAKSPAKRKRDRERAKKRRARQFGNDGYREEILRTPCLVRGTLPVDPAHVLGTRGAGHGPDGLAPLSREIHRAFDSSMTDERLWEVYGFTRETIREWARARRQAWLDGCNERWVPTLEERSRPMTFNRGPAKCPDGSDV